MINFRSITPAVIAAADKKPGYSDLLYYCLQSEIETWANPVNDGSPGSSKRIIANHLWAANKGVHSIQAKAKSVTGTSSTQGEVGEAVIEYQQKFIIKGDSDVINELIEGLLNEDLVFFFNDPTCGQTRLVQFGSKCTPANISAPAFNAGSRGSGGSKGYEITITSPDKFFYNGDLTEAVETTQLATPENVAASNATAEELLVSWDAVEGAETYTIQRSTDPTFATDVMTSSEVVASPQPYVGLVADTIYYVRVKAVAAGYPDSEWALVAQITT